MIFLLSSGYHLGKPSAHQPGRAPSGDLSPDQVRQTMITQADFMITDPRAAMIRR
jgi:hypothetical protein